jgi:hypothetical protein
VSHHPEEKASVARSPEAPPKAFRQTRAQGSRARRLRTKFPKWRRLLEETAISAWKSQKARKRIERTSVMANDGLERELIVMPLHPIRHISTVARTEHALFKFKTGLSSGPDFGSSERDAPSFWGQSPGRLL